MATKNVYKIYIDNNWTGMFHGTPSQSADKVNEMRMNEQRSGWNREVKTEYICTESQYQQAKQSV